MPRDPGWLYVESVRSVLIVLVVFVVQVVKWYEARRGEAESEVAASRIPSIFRR